MQNIRLYHTVPGDEREKRVEDHAKRRRPVRLVRAYSFGGIVVVVSVPDAAR
jgi:hypothetical protein